MEMLRAVKTNSNPPVPLLEICDELRSGIHLSSDPIDQLFTLGVNQSAVEPVIQSPTNVCLLYLLEAAGSLSFATKQRFFVIYAYEEQ